MHISKLTALFVLMGICGHAAAQFTPPKDQGHGAVKFIGAIIDAPCSIAPESVDQTIQMGEISASLLEKNGASPVRPFEIHLENCDIDTAMSATVSFNGIPSGNSYLALNGGGAGGSLALVNKNSGADIVIGQATKVADLVNDDRHLKFGAKIIRGAEDRSDILPGEFDVSSDFIMTYQ
jgi:type 1 fimbria pilin